MTQRHLSNALGSYSDREEFQIGRVIVWVRIPGHGSRDTWLQRADLLIEDIWRAIPTVLSAAQQESRALIPEFWKLHDEAGTADEQLTVWGIWIDLIANSTDFHVGGNHDFNCPIGLPELPDGHCIMVSRDLSGTVAAR